MIFRFPIEARSRALSGSGARPSVPPMELARQCGWLAGAPISSGYDPRRRWEETPINGTTSVKCGLDLLGATSVKRGLDLLGSASVKRNLNLLGVASGQCGVDDELQHR
jgi:hypothetical protein